MNEYCWMNWIVGIGLIIFGIITNSYFTLIFGGFNLGYAFCGVVAILKSRRYAYDKQGETKDG